MIGGWPSLKVMRDTETQMISDERILGSSEFVETVLKSANETYNGYPLLCFKCLGSMRIIVIIEDKQLVKKILNHLGLWNVRRKN